MFTFRPAFPLALYLSLSAKTPFLTPWLLENEKHYVPMTGLPKTLQSSFSPAFSLFHLSNSASIQKTLGEIQVRLSLSVGREAQMGKRNEKETQLRSVAIKEAFEGSARESLTYRVGRQRTSLQRVCRREDSYFCA